MNRNRQIVYSSPYLVLASTLSLACLSTILIISVPSPSRFFRRLSPSSQHHGEIPPADAQKNSTLLQTYILTWLFLVVSTIAVGQLGIGGVYVVSAWNVGVLAGVMVGVVEGLVWGLAVGVVAGEVSEGETEAHGASELEGDGATEDTPLLRPQRASTDVQPVGRNAKQDGAFGWWFVQLLLVVPIPVILVSHIGLVLLGALPQTLVDGSSAAVGERLYPQRLYHNFDSDASVVVYAAISFLSILLVLPLAPFAHKVHGFVTCVILVIFLLSTAYAWTAFPFTMDAPLKVFFQQRVRLAPARFASMSSVSPASWLNASHSDYAIYAPVSAHTSLTGLSSFLESRIIAQLPSARGKDVSCAEAEGRAKGSGMETCTWEVDVRGEMGPDPVGSTWEEGWLVVNTTRIGGNTGRIAVRGVNARACSVYFNRPVRWWKVLEGEEGGMGGVMQSGYEAPEEGVNTLALWSRTWDREFAVEVGLVGEGRLDGRVGCEWAEYESGTVGIAGVGARIPALEEVLKYLPLWAVVSKVGSGLVQGWADFHV
jgi:hypothetical protein